MTTKKDKPKKILFLCQYFYPETLSSAVLPYELATEFFEHGYSVSALVGYPNEYLKSNYDVPMKQNVHGINVERLKYTGVDRHSKLGRVANILSFSMAVMAHPKKIKDADVLICTTNPPLLPYVTSIFAKQHHKKLITIMFDVYPDDPIKLGYLQEKSKIASGFNMLYQKVFKRSSWVVAISSEMKKYLIRYKGVEDKKIAVIQNWYQNIHQSLEYKTSEPITILYGGNMGEAQDMETVLEVTLKLKNDNRFKFLFVGQGSKKDYVRDFIKKNEIKNCELHDFLEKEKYDKLIENVSMTILSLKSEIWGLGSPSKFYGYIAAKKPVIAIVPDDTDISKDIDGYQNGIWAKNGDSDSVVKELIECANHPEKLKQMSEQSFKLFLDKYTLSKSFEKYKKLVEE